MGLQAEAVMVAVLLQGAKLPRPIDEALADRLPFVFAARLAGHALAVAMADAIFWQRIVAIRIWNVPRESPRIAGVPVDHEVLVRNRRQHGRAFFPGAGVAG